MRYKAALPWLLPLALLLLPLVARGQELPTVAALDPALSPTVAYLLQASPLAALVYGALLLRDVLKSGINFQIKIHPESIKDLAAEISSALRED